MALTFLKDIQTAFHLLTPHSGNSHAERLENFYSRQAKNYDDFRKKLLPGREKLMQRLSVHSHGNWADLGAGTGSNLDFIGYDNAQRFEKIHLVDLAPSLLEVAKQRVAQNKLNNISFHNHDICSFEAEQPLDLITLSYSLTMVPRWYEALQQAKKLLKPGGLIAVVDFYVSEKYSSQGLQQHSSFVRNFWPLWFSWDNVHLNKDHLPYLIHQFKTIELLEGKSQLPFVPLSSVPYFSFIGQKE